MEFVPDVKKAAFLERKHAKIARRRANLGRSIFCLPRMDSNMQLHKIQTRS